MLFRGELWVPVLSPGCIRPVTMTGIRARRFLLYLEELLTDFDSGLDGAYPGEVGARGTMTGGGAGELEERPLDEPCCVIILHDPRVRETKRERGEGKRK